MSSATIDGELFRHPKFAALPLTAVGAWVKGMSWCAYKLSDGRISEQAVKFLQLPPGAIQALLKAELWEPAADGNGYVVHDYLHWNPSRAQVEAERESAKRRAAKSRAIKKEIVESSGALSDMAAAEPEQEEAAEAVAPSAVATVYELRPTRFAEKAGAAWFKALTGTKPDKGWAPELGRIGEKPDRERDIVAKHLRETSFLQNEDGNITVSPKHVLLYWGDYIRGPKGKSPIKPTVSTRAPGMPSSKSEIELMQVPEWARAEAE